MGIDVEEKGGEGVFERIVVSYECIGCQFTFLDVDCGNGVVEVSRGGITIPRSLQVVASLVSLVPVLNDQSTMFLQVALNARCLRWCREWDVDGRVEC